MPRYVYDHTILGLVLIKSIVIFLLDFSESPSNCSNGDVRLVGGTTSHEGRVEICINQVWGSICSNIIHYYYYYYYNFDAVGKIVCRQLGHLELGKKVAIVLPVTYIFVFRTDIQFI